MNTPTPKANSASDWIRGYFCAVAKMIELEGQVQPDAAELFRCGGDARRADLEDQEIFREHGLLPNTKGSRAEERKLTALTAERDELRGALALGQQNCDDVYDELRVDCDELRADVVRLTARAERAEAAQTVALARWNGALERAMKAEAELAAERARLNDLVADLNDACITIASVKDDCDDYAMQNTAFKLTAVRDVLLQYIPNAATKEGAK